MSYRSDSHAHTHGVVVQNRDSDGYAAAMDEYSRTFISNRLPGCITAADASSVTVSCDGEPADVRVRADAVIVCTGYLPPTPRVTRVMEPQPKSCELLYKVVPRSVDVDRDDASERTVVGGAFRGTTFGGSVRGAATHPDRSIAIERPPCTNSQRVAVVGSSPLVSS